MLVAVVAGAQLLRNPPPGYVPAGWTPPAPKQGAAAKTDFTPTEMLRTPAFWVLWLTYFAACAAGLQVIMKASPVWQSFRIGVLTPPSGKPVVLAIYYHATRESAPDAREAVIAEATRLALKALGHD